MFAEPEADPLHKILHSLFTFLCVCVCVFHIGQDFIATQASRQPTTVNSFHLRTI